MPKTSEPAERLAVSVVERLADARRRSEAVALTAAEVEQLFETTLDGDEGEAREAETVGEVLILAAAAEWRGRQWYARRSAA